MSLKLSGHKIHESSEIWHHVAPPQTVQACMRASSSGSSTGKSTSPHGGSSPAARCLFQLCMAWVLPLSRTPAELRDSDRQYIHPVCGTRAVAGVSSSLELCNAAWASPTPHSCSNTPSSCRPVRTTNISSRAEAWRARACNVREAEQACTQESRKHREEPSARHGATAGRPPRSELTTSAATHEFRAKAWRFAREHCAQCEGSRTVAS